MPDLADYFGEWKVSQKGTNADLYGERVTKNTTKHKGHNVFFVVSFLVRRVLCDLFILHFGDSPITQPYPNIVWRLIKPFFKHALGCK